MTITETLNIILNKYTDRYGLIVQSNMDGGDTCHKTGILYSLLHMLDCPVNHRGEDIKEGFERDVVLLELKPGVLARHPDPPWNDIDPHNDVDFDPSRDQEASAITAMELLGDKDRLLRVTNSIINNNYMYHNEKDIIGPEQLAQLVRVHNKETFLSSLLGDIFLALHSVIRVFVSVYDPDDTSNDAHHIINLLTARKYRPTVTNWLAKIIYKCRMNAGPKRGEGPRLKGFAPQTAVDWYFRPSENGPPLNELYRPLIERYLK